MLQIHTYRFRSLNNPCDYRGTIMPSTDKAERFLTTCLIRAGSSGYLGPGALMCILE